MNNFLLYFGFFLVLVFAALFGVPFAVDWNSYRGVFEEEASQVLGREVRVAGNVGLKLLPAPYFEFEKIRVGPAPGEKLTGTSFKADDFRMWISVPPLLKGVLEANKIELRKPVIETVLSKEKPQIPSPKRQISAHVTTFFSNVTLQSVHLIDGSLTVVDPNGSNLLEFDQVNGELSADALIGPYRFNGQYLHGDSPRQLRVSTSELDEKGDLRFKGSVTAPTSGNTYTLEAVARNIFGVPTVEGDFKARINGTSFVSHFLDSRGTGDAFHSKDHTLSFEVTSPLKMGRDQLVLEDITLNVEDSTLPQFIKGRSLLTWKDRPTLDVALSSKWLNLDPILPKNEQSSPLPPSEVLPALTKGLVEAFPKETDFKFNVSIDQLEFNKQKVSALHVALEKAEGSIDVKEVKADFPGNSRLDLKGEFTSEKEGERTFYGGVRVEGQSLSQFSDWMLGDGRGASAKSSKETPYSLSADIKIGSEQVELSKLSAAYKNVPIAGNFNLVWKERPHLTAALNSPKLDLEVLGVGSLLNILSVAGRTEEVPQGATAQDSKGSFIELFKNQKWVQNADWNLDLQAKSLFISGLEVEDVAIAAGSHDGHLSLSKIQLRSSESFSIDLKSTISDPHSTPSRQLKGTLQVASAEGERKAIKLFSLSKDTEDFLKGFARLTPWALACEVNLGEGAQSNLELKLKGKIAGGQADIGGRLEDPWRDWQTAQTDWKVTLESSQLDRFFKPEVQIENTIPATTIEATGGKLVLKATGKPSEGLDTSVQLKTENETLEFNGKTSITKSRKILASGTIGVETNNLSRVFLFTGFPEFKNYEGISIKGNLQLKKSEEKVLLQAESVMLGTSSVSGSVTLGPDLTQKPLSLDAKVAVDHVSVPALFNVLSEPLPAGSPSFQRLVTDQPDGLNDTSLRVLDAGNTINQKSLWPEAPFDLTLLQVLNGTIELSVGSLDFDTNVAIKKAHAHILLTSEGFNIKSLEGTALGGNVASDFLLERQTLGVLGKGTISLTIPDQTSLSGAGEREKSPLSATLQAKFEGKALSPRNLLDTFDGAGTLNIDRWSIQGGAPKAVSDASKAFLQDKFSKSPKVLADVIKAELQRNKLEIKKVAVPVEIHQGTFRIGKIEANTDFGRTTIETDLNLQTLELKSILNILGFVPVWEKATKKGSRDDQKSPSSSPNVGQGKKDFLPPVSVLYAGQFGNLEILNPKITLEPLQRELVVRRLELDANELETLRKQDESTSQHSLDPVSKENVLSGSDKELGITPTNKAPTPVQSGDSPQQQKNSDITSSTSPTSTAEHDNKVGNASGSHTPPGDVTTNLKPETTEPSPSSTNGGQQNSSAPKQIKKKQPDSYWPSFNFWPF